MPRSRCSLGWALGYNTHGNDYPGPSAPSHHTELLRRGPAPELHLEIVDEGEGCVLGSLVFYFVCTATVQQATPPGHQAQRMG